MRRSMRVYADTSVFGGTQDTLFEESSNLFFEQVRTGHFQLVISGLVEQELRNAPEPVQAVLQEFLSIAEIAPISQAALALQRAYLAAGILTPNWEEDALHVALATVSDCAAIVSWNFKHIVNLRRISLYNAVSTLQGYRPIEIRSPVEVLNYEEPGR